MTFINYCKVSRKNKSTKCIILHGGGFLNDGDDDEDVLQPDLCKKKKKSKAAQNGFQKNLNVV